MAQTLSSQINEINMVQRRLSDFREGQLRQNYTWLQFLVIIAFEQKKLYSGDVSCVG